LTNYLYNEFDHIVQAELFGLSLTKPGTVARKPYYIEFQLVSGGKIEKLDLFIDGELDLGTTWDENTLTGRSTYNPDGDLYPGVHDILIQMANSVSEVVLIGINKN